MLQKSIDQAELWKMQRCSALKINHTGALQDTTAPEKNCSRQNFSLWLLFPFDLGRAFTLL